ncbi:MAG: ASCH domain-containing protein [Planctomycetia bacterium]|nr:ASCH domain-containing protein [Planctomycetia bacterium]
MLTFKRKFLDAIRRGEKTQTLRIWKYLRVHPGQKSYIPGIGPIMIDSAEQVNLSDLTDADAIPDGFPTIEALKKEIRKIYGTFPEGEMYRIRFHILEDSSKKSEEKTTDSAPCNSQVTESVPIIENRMVKKENSQDKPFIHEMKGDLIGSLSVATSKETKDLRMDSGKEKNQDKNCQSLTSQTEPESHKKPTPKSLTEAEVVKKLVQRCRVNRNVCDWNHEPGKSQDFFSLFMLSPRDERGIPTLDGYRLRSLMRDEVTHEEWDPICWIAEEVCRAWTEWQYAIEHWTLAEK